MCTTKLYSPGMHTLVTTTKKTNKCKEVIAIQLLREWVVFGGGWIVVRKGPVEGLLSAWSCFILWVVPIRVFSLL